MAARGLMQKQESGGFWNSVSLVSLAVAFMTLAALSSATLFQIPRARFVARTIAVLRSRAVVTNPGVVGYYEQLFGAAGHAMFMSDEEFKRFSKGTLSRLFVARTRHGAPEFDYDGILMYRFKPNLKGLRSPSEPQGVTTNSLGFLGPEYSLAKPPNTERIVLLGDSVTQGWGNDQNSSYGRLLENKLNRGGGSRRFEILNFGMPGYLLTQMLPLAEKDAARLNPDIYMLALTELAVGRTWSEHLIRLVQSGIDPEYPFFKDALRKAGVSPYDDPLTSMDKMAPFRIPVLRAMLAELKSFAASRHAEFFVALVPSLEDGNMSRIRLRGIREVLESLNIPFVDVTDTFDGVLNQEPLRINPQDVHPNTLGHTMIANNLFARLQARPEFRAAGK